MKVYEKYAWILLFAIGVIFLVTGVPHALGINTDPETVQRISGMTIDQLKDSNPAFFNLYSFYFSFGGLDDIGFGFFVTVISLTAYRKGEKWSWYALWFLPAYFIGSSAITMSIESTINIESFLSMLLPITMFAILSLVGLLLPFRKFFPSKTSLKA